ncbi:putative non-specific serine/threonine protein kinase [Dioscorea sansibarensis]
MFNLSDVLSHQSSFNTNSNLNPCSWTSWVNCSTPSSSSSSSQVIGINLSGYGLSTEATTNTSFFSLLCHIDSLWFLNLSNNKFESLPDSFLSNCSGLTQLRDLDISFNLLSGQLPDLELNDNQFEGDIPLSLLKCEDLSLLNLGGNKLQGVLPKELGSLTKLVVLELQMNNLDGSIPDEIYQLVNLNILNLSQNSFSGGISPLISRLNKVQFLNLNDNKLGGQIPDSVGNIGPLLIELQLGNNKLNGSIPQMYRNGQMTAFNLSSNLFMGPLPESLSELFILEVLDLSDNKFTGGVPSSFTRMRSLTKLDLSNNQLTGILPNFPRWVSVITAGNNIQNATNLNTASQSRRRINSFIIIVVAICSCVGFSLLSGVLVITVLGLGVPIREW